MTPQEERIAREAVRRGYLDRAQARALLAQLEPILAKLHGKLPAPLADRLGKLKARL